MAGPHDRHGTIRRPSELVSLGLVPASHLRELERVAERFSVAVTADLMDLFDPANPADPIARQFLPDRRELDVLPEENPDPIADDPFSPVKGITHRYPDRLLLKPVHVCAAYCRFCFRREKVGPGSAVLSNEELGRALDYIQNHPEVWEIILTGGDPLVLSPSKLGEILRSLFAIEHIRLIRVHTRVPVMDPDRITPDLVAALKSSKPVWVVLHCNHPRELGAKTRNACAALVDAGIPMLAQTVLLKGVNDDPNVLKELFRDLVVARIKPYYLHHGDLALGTSHFRTTIEEGRGLVRALRAELSGICQPTYVLDIPGGHGKVPIGPTYLHEKDSSGVYRVEDPSGHVHAYPPAPPPGASINAGNGPRR